MIPVLAADAQRIAEAQRTRPDGHTDRDEGARARVALIGAMLTGSLDRAMDVAATLELRGFAAAPRVPRLSRPWSRHDLAFAVSAAAISRSRCSPGSAALPRSPPTRWCTHPSASGLFALCGALVLAILLPFADRRGIEP